ncbi:MAG: ATP-binding protein [Treponema sp.]|jgi:predicted ATPase|nr:ATP-binding protein [Treponema sp.]
MITRLYVNNYRALVAFEMKFDSMGVFCGVNGVGKSSMFDAIRFIRDLAIGNCFLGGLVDHRGRTVFRLEFTFWIDSTTQEFELELEENGYHFRYLLHLEQLKTHEPRIIKEAAFCNDRELYTRDLDGVHFDNGRSGFPLDWRQAALASIQPVPERREIEQLQNALANLLVLRPNIHEIECESTVESRILKLGLSNLTSWYRYLAQDQECTDILRESLKYVWPDLKFLKLEDAGMSFKVLKLCFEGIDLRFDQLSDGEKMLVGLYTIHAALSLNKVSTVLIDEPDNFISLQELQPWLLSMSELIDESHQVLIISHNAEIIDSNPSRGFLFWRDNHVSPVRAGPLTIPQGLTVGEALTRGWVITGGGGIDNG